VIRFANVDLCFFIGSCSNITLCPIYPTVVNSIYKLSSKTEIHKKYNLIDDLSSFISHVTKSASILFNLHLLQTKVILFSNLYHLLINIKILTIHLYIHDRWMYCRANDVITKTGNDKFWSTILFSPNPALSENMACKLSVTEIIS
jgi:hypothetical protein